MSFGRVHCFLVATKGGDVVYERFYDRLSEIEKAEVREAFQHAASGVHMTSDDQDFACAYKNARFVFIPTADLVFFLLGSGEYDELASSEILRVIISVLKDILGKMPTAGLLLDKYAKFCIIVDEIINEGILEATDREAIRKALKHKRYWHGVLMSFNNRAINYAEKKRPNYESFLDGAGSLVDN